LFFLQTTIFYRFSSFQLKLSKIIYIEILNNEAIHSTDGKTQHNSIFYRVTHSKARYPWFHVINKCVYCS